MFTNMLTIDLFCGIGGIRTGFKDLISEVVFSSEIDKFASAQYELNYGDKPHGDITRIEAPSIPSFDLLLAGFPCQAFSIAGARKGFEDTRGTLFFDVARIIDYHRPKVVFLENVKGLLTHDKGNTFKIILETLEGLGYKVYYQILNAKDFGVPQNRERIYIVCFKDDIHFEFPVGDIKSKVSDILLNTIPSKYTISDRLWEGHKRRKIEHQLKGNGFGYRLFDEDSLYTSTLSARYYKDGSEILIKQKGLNPRKLVPRECARLQGFPDSYKIECSDVQAYKQFGNSVAVPVIEAIAERIKEALIINKTLS